MPSLFSARSFADRAAQRGTDTQRPDEADPAAEALGAPTSEGNAHAIAPAANGALGEAAPAFDGPGAHAPRQIDEAHQTLAPNGHGATHADGDRGGAALTSVDATSRAQGILSERPTASMVSRNGAAKPAPYIASADRRATMLIPQPPAGTLRLTPLQALAKGARWRTEAMRSYRHPVLYWFTRGQGRITLAGLTRGYGAHNAVFVPPRCMHGFEVTAQVFGTAIFFNEQHDLPLPAEPVHLRVRDALSHGEMTTILEQLGREIDGDRPLRERAIGHHAGLMTVWLDRQIALAAETVPDTAALRLVRRFTEAVEAQLYTGQGVSDYAEVLGVTPTHLSRVCRETAGRSASDILADRVTFEARRLLAETTLPVKQVAQILGFGSAAYFTRAFQNRTGQTPSQFRAAA